MENNETPKFTVKSVESVEEKSTQQVEQELLNKHEESLKVEESSPETDKVEVSSNTETTTETKEEPQEQSGGLEDKDVLEYIKNRYNKEINSVEDLFAQREENEELPEDVSAFFKYKKETGRGIQDYMNLQKDYDEMEADSVIANYYAQTEEGLDEIDIQDLMDDRFGYDEDVDEERDIKKRKLAHKRELAKAKKFFKEQQEQFRIPLESSGEAGSPEQREEFNRYKSYVEDSKTREEQMKKRYDWFVDKSQEVFSSDFKGFNFTVNDKQYTYKPGDGQELFNKQKDVNNFIQPYLDADTGMMKDAQGYHRAMSIAMNPERFAKFFYEQGKAEAIDNVSKKSKNIDMVRKAPQSMNKNGLKIRAVGDTSSGKGLKIKSIKKV
jgi:hypothetical protein